MTEHLAPGAWNRMELTLAPAKAADIGHLEIEMVTDVVVMPDGRGRWQRRGVSSSGPLSCHLNSSLGAPPARSTRAHQIRLADRSTRRWEK
jgi:hypothetical protein